MTLSNIADFADLIAAVAIVVSLIFVGYELHQTRVQSELSNWRDILKSMTDFKAVTNDVTFAEMVTRGQADYAGLSDAEKLSFGLYLEQGIHIFGNFLKHNDSLPQKLTGREDAIGAHFRDLLDTPGGRIWWDEAQADGRFMPETYLVTNALLAKQTSKD